VIYGTRGATVRIGDALALDDVSVEINPGDIVAIVGGDGAGKTTLLRTFVGQVRLLAGAVFAPPSDEIGYLPATAGSWPSLSVAQNMDFVGGIYGLAGQDLVERRTALLERAGLLRARDRLASQLSGGMRRKLGFCMAFLHRPRLLVLDEPSTGVDPVSRVDLWRLVSLAAAEGAAVILSTTYLDEAERAATLVALDAGTTLVQGPPFEILGASEGVVTATSRPHRRDWAWRRGRTFHEYWPEGLSAPAGDPAITPDLEDVVIALSLVRRSSEEARA
jgi:ABC-type multidrug transport system ATPase subunit